MPKLPSVAETPPKAQVITNKAHRLSNLMEANHPFTVPENTVCRVCGKNMRLQTPDFRVLEICCNCLSCPFCGGSAHPLFLGGAQGNVYNVTIRCMAYDNSCGIIENRTRADLVMSAKKWRAIKEDKAKKAEIKRKEKLAVQYHVPTQEIGLLEKIVKSHENAYAQQGLDKVAKRMVQWARENKKEFEVYKTLKELVKE